ncbi:MAG: permease [Cohaesibacteraceae bacterium]
MAGPTRTPFYRDVGFLFILVLSAGSATAVYLRDGAARFLEILRDDAVLWLTVLPKVAAGVMVAAFLRILLPKEVVARWIGERSGLKGLFVATLAGALIPGGPMTIFPIATSLYLSGADRGSTVAFITGWLTLGINRAVVWELSFFEPEFVVLRTLVSLPIPILCGIAARMLPGRTEEQRAADKTKPRPQVRE